MTYSFHFYCLYPIYIIYEGHLETTKVERLVEKKKNKIKKKYNTVRKQ